jgi:hypothetical protein
MSKPSRFPQVKTASSTVQQIRKQPVAPPVYRPQPAPQVLQRKAVVKQSPAGQAHPVAPPVYRPQPVPQVLQLKTAHNPQPQAKQSQPVAPAVYRPQPLPKVLQTKKNAVDRSASPSRSAPVAPPVYRPQPLPQVLQRKSAVAPLNQPSNQPKRPPAAPAVYRPQQNRIMQPKAAGAAQIFKPPQPAPTARAVNTASVQCRTGVIQPLILVPFDHADQELIDFAKHRTEGLAPGPVEIGTQVKHKLGVDETLVLVGHGNGTTFYSHEKETAKNFKAYGFAELSKYLAENVLPDNYKGKILLWSCDSARPWKHIPTLAEHYGEDVDTSFIEQFESYLGEEKKGYKPDIYGAIGYATLGKHWEEAEVFANETLKHTAEKRDFKHGFIRSGEKVDPAFYDLDGEDDDDYNDYEEDNYSDNHMDSSSSSSKSIISTRSTRSTRSQQIPVSPQPSPQEVPTFTSQQQYLDYITRNTPSGGSSHPPSFKQRLKKLQDKK